MTNMSDTPDDERNGDHSVSVVPERQVEHGELVVPPAGGDEPEELSNSVTERVSCRAPKMFPFLAAARPLVPEPSMKISQSPPGVYLTMSPLRSPPGAPWTKFEN